MNENFIKIIARAVNLDARGLATKITDFTGFAHPKTNGDIVIVGFDARQDAELPQDSTLGAAVHRVFVDPKTHRSCILAVRTPDTRAWLACLASPEVAAAVARSEGLQVNDDLSATVSADHVAALY